MKNSKLIRNIIFAVVGLVILAGAYYFVLKMPEKPIEPGEPEIETPTSIEVFNVKSDEINAINIKNSTDNFTVERKGQNEYAVREYPNIEFSNSKLTTLIYDFTTITAETEITGNSGFELGIGAASVTVYLNDGNEQSFLLGNKVAGKNAYFMQSLDKIYVISSYKAESFQKELKSLRETAVASIDNQTVSALSIEKDGKKFMEIRNINDDETSRFSMVTSFVMTYPNYVSAASDKYGELLQKITGITAVDFVSDTVTPADLTKYGIGKLTLTVTDGEGTHKIKYGNKDEKGNVYAVYDGKNMLFTQNSAMFDAMAGVDPLSLIDKFAHLINIEDVSQVEFIEYDMEKMKTELLPVKEKFVLKINGSGDGTTYEINGNSISDEKFKKIYQAVIGLTTNGFTENKSWLGNMPEYGVDFFNKDGKSFGGAVYREYDERNYAVVQNGESEFIILKKKLTAAVQEIKEILSE
jgi:hypothetical protein